MIGSKRKRDTAKCARLTMVQAMPGEQPKTESTRIQEKKRMRMYVVQTPGYVNHSVFLFRSAGGTAFTYSFAMNSEDTLLTKKNPNCAIPDAKVSTFQSNAFDSKIMGLLL